MRNKVVIVWRDLADYRVPFYLRLREYLAEREIELHVIFGRTDPGQGEVERQLLPWGRRVRDYRLRFGGFEICWQPYGACLKDADLVIVEQANRLLLNYWLLATRRFSLRKVAFWGHGRDLQNPPGTIRNTWKRLFINQVDWWFAYSEEVGQELVNNGFPRERVTNVQNTIDTDVLRRGKSRTSPRRLEQLRLRLGLGTGPVGIYCGRFYKEKRIEFLLRACEKVRERIPSFELIVIGAGEGADRIASAARRNRWIHYVGPKYGEERIPYFLLSSLFLMPGLVGLAILDSFALEVPLVTTEYPFHSPEIVYLKNGENGIMTADSIETYATGVHRALTDPELLGRLRTGCRESASTYTMGAMVKNFGGGILACLSAKEPAATESATRVFQRGAVTGSSRES